MSILESTKAVLGIPKDHTAFDKQVIMHINSVFTILNQLGADKFTITGYDETWDDYFSKYKDLDLEFIESYLPMKVRMMFDTPTSGTTAEAFNKLIAEYEWRIRITFDEKDTTE